jgi:hypothetical protein
VPKFSLIFENNLDFESKQLVNLTDLEVPHNVQRILKLGPKFNMPSDKEKIPYHNIIADVESGISFIEDEDKKTQIRNGVSNILMNCKRSTNDRFNLTEKILKLQFKDAKGFLNDHPELCLTVADKGNATVLLFKTEYDQKMHELLRDATTYEVIRRHSTEVLQRKVNGIVSIWEDSGFIDKLQARKLRTYNGTISKMYGLPKIHKVGVPFKPIVSCINSPTYNLSRFYGDVINNVLYKTESFVRNSEEFKDFLLSIRIPEGYSIISLDVQSLFTSIDSESVIECVRSRWNHISHHTSLPLARFLEGLELILDNCFFVFDGITYHQIHGTPMGSPVSPVLAGLVMEELEISVLASLNFSPIFYKRYVDDIIVCLPTDEILMR